MQMYRTVSESGITRTSTAVDGTSVDTHPVHVLAHMHSRSGERGPALEPQPRADCGQHAYVQNPHTKAQEVEPKVTSQVVGLWEVPIANLSRSGVNEIHPSSLKTVANCLGVSSSSEA